MILANQQNRENRKIKKTRNLKTQKITKSHQIRKPMNLKKQKTRQTHKLWKWENAKIQKIGNPRVTTFVKTRRRRNPTTEFLPRPRNTQAAKPTNSQIRKPGTCKTPDNHKCPQFENVHPRIPGHRHSTKWCVRRKHRFSLIWDRRNGMLRITESKIFYFRPCGETAE